jgi:NAD-dependent SIR2 family protein deacetylase
MQAVLDACRANLAAATRAALVCPRCGAMTRPRILWFDESYDEPRLFLDTVRRSPAISDTLISR